MTIKWCPFVDRDCKHVDLGGEYAVCKARIENGDECEHFDLKKEKTDD